MTVPFAASSFRNAAITTSIARIAKSAGHSRMQRVAVRGFEYEKGHYGTTKEVGEAATAAPPRRVRTYAQATEAIDHGAETGNLPAQTPLRKDA